MPKVNDTRAQRAAELLRMIEQGPSLSRPWGAAVFTVEDAERQCKLWLDTWVAPLVKDLVPELRTKRPRRRS